MEHKPLFGDLIAAHEGLAEELKAVDVAADLTLLLHHSGKSRADLARALGWSRARVTQVLSGQENLTVQTIAAVTKALGYTFDAAFRKVGAPSAAQPWDAQATLALDMVDAPDLQSWMSGNFSGAVEVLRSNVRPEASNHSSIREEIACAA